MFVEWELLRALAKERLVTEPTCPAHWMSFLPTGQHRHASARHVVHDLAEST